MATIMENIAAVLLLAGAFFALVGSYGTFRLKDFFQRVHAPTKATTLGVGCTVLASAFYFTGQTGSLQMQELLIVMFLFITAPVSAHTLTRAAIHLRVKSEARTRGQPWKH